jgi:hypothetical protein
VYTRNAIPEESKNCTLGCERSDAYPVVQSEGKVAELVPELYGRGTGPEPSQRPVSAASRPVWARAIFLFENGLPLWSQLKRSTDFLKAKTLNFLLSKLFSSSESFCSQIDAHLLSTGA